MWKLEANHEWKNQYIWKWSRKKPSYSIIIVNKLLKTHQNFIFVVQRNVALSCTRIRCSKLSRITPAATIISRLKKNIDAVEIKKSLKNIIDEDPPQLLKNSIWCWVKRKKLTYVLNRLSLQSKRTEPGNQLIRYRLRRRLKKCGQKLSAVKNLIKKRQGRNCSFRNRGKRDNCGQE